MTPAEKLLKIDEGVEETIALNAELEQTLYGTDTGGKSFYDEFWDTYQENGNRSSYKHAFAGNGWTNEPFKPKYNILPKGSDAAYMLFRDSGIEGDLVQILEDLGIEMDLSGCVGWTSYIFSSTKLTRIGKIDLRRASALASVFAGSNQLHTIDELIVAEGVGFSSDFLNCETLQNLTMSGVIGQNGLNLQWSTKLSKASITSIINALSTTTSGLTVTLSKTAVNNAFDGGSTGNEWTTIIGTRSNWTISLV